MLAGGGVEEEAETAAAAAIAREWGLELGLGTEEGDGEVGDV
jgi:hypothetical protein